MNNNKSSGGIGFFGLLSIVFIALKLIGVIDWSWWLVLMPLYAPVLVALVILFGVFMYYMIFEFRKIGGHKNGDMI